MYNHTAMNLFFRKVFRTVVIGFALIVLLLLGWLGYVSYLTIQNDRACGCQLTMIKESNYTQNDEELQRALDNYSAGGILSTSEDVAFFVHSLFTGRILDGSTLAQMKAFIRAPDEDMPSQIGYGLGIRNLIIGGENLIGHTGTIPGYSGIAMHNEKKHYTIVILSNLSVIEQTQIFEEVQNIVIDRLQMQR